MQEKPQDFNDFEDQEEEALFEHYKLKVDPGQKPLRIDKFLVNRVDNASRSRIQMAAEAGSIRVNARL